MGAKQWGETPEESGGFKKRGCEFRNVKGDTYCLEPLASVCFSGRLRPSLRPHPCPLCAGASGAGARSPAHLRALI